MLRRGRLIVFLGPVGVGKSTVIRGLAVELRARSFRVSTVFIKAFHGPSYLLWMFIAGLLGLRIDWIAPWYIIPKSGRLELARALTALSIYLDTFIMIPFKLLKMFMFRALGFYVLSEEYIHSTLIDYVYSCIMLRLRCRLLKLPLLLLSLLLSKYVPDRIVVLNASNSVLRRRWRLRGYGDPQLHYVKIQRALLLKIADRGVFIIDTNGLSIADVVKLIMNKVTESMD